MARLLNIDNNNENADWIKSRSPIDINGIDTFYDLIKHVGIDMYSDGGLQDVIDFYESHPYINTMVSGGNLIYETAKKMVASGHTSAFIAGKHENA